MEILSHILVAICASLVTIIVIKLRTKINQFGFDDEMKLFEDYIKRTHPSLPLETRDLGGGHKEYKHPVTRLRWEGWADARYAQLERTRT